jgi:hypothetical protein
MHWNRTRGLFLADLATVLMIQSRSQKFMLRSYTTESLNKYTLSVRAVSLPLRHPSIFSNSLCASAIQSETVSEELPVL